MAEKGGKREKLVGEGGCRQEAVQVGQEGVQV